MERTFAVSSSSQSSWLSEALGESIPKDNHAVSVSLPTWSSVVGYEEGDPNIITKLQTGYPRFKVHLYHEILAKFLLFQKILPAQQWRCSSWPSEEVAKRLINFLNFDFPIAEDKVQIERIGNTQYFSVFYDVNLESKVKLFWQHTGEILSSRQVARILKMIGLSVPNIWDFDWKSNFILNDCEIFESCKRNISLDLVEERGNCSQEIKLTEALKKRIKNVVELQSNEVNIDNITLTVSGIASIFSSLRMIQSVMGDGIVIIFGFPYLDTLKIMQRCEFNASGCIFLGFGDNSDLVKLEAILDRHNGADSNELHRITCVFTEFPSNPLLRTPDIEQLSQLVDKFNAVLAVDDTISSFANVKLLDPSFKVDILCSSLTKIFSGIGNVHAGSIIVNPFSRYCSDFVDVLKSNKLMLPSLEVEDLEVLEQNSRDYLSRVKMSNENALKLALKLQSDERCKATFYPGLPGVEGHEHYQKLLRNEHSGFGCLLSFVLADSHSTAKFYDSLNLSKGPSLGTNYTLVCPYTLLAHYCEIEWASSFGLDREIIRVSVGQEDFEEIWAKFEDALVVSKIS